MSKITFHVRGGVSKKLNNDIAGVLRRAVLEEIVHECADRLSDALMAVMDLEGLSAADYVGEGLRIAVEIEKAEEGGEE